MLFLKRFTISSRVTDNDYLYRLRIIDCKWFGIYLHVIAEPDSDAHLHNHPTTFHSFIIEGSYIEDHRSSDRAPIIKRGHDRFGWNHIKYGEFHKIVAIDGPVWTIVFRGRRRSSWGFLVNDIVIDYTEYLATIKWGDETNAH